MNPFSKVFLLFLSSVMLITVSSCTFKPGESILQLNHENLTACNRNALYAETENAAQDPYMIFAFTDSQKQLMKEKAAEGYALKIHLSLLNENDFNAAEDFKFGFLYESDFADPAFTKVCNNGKHSYFLVNQIMGNFSYLKNGEADLLLCFKDTAPEGFMVYSRNSCCIDSVSFCDCCIGFNLRNGKCLYAFGPSGGRIPSDTKEFDFTSAASVFPADFSKGVPDFILGFDSIPDAGTYDRQVRAIFTYGKEKIAVRRRTASQIKIIPASAFTENYGKMTFIQNGNQVNELLLSMNEKSAPENRVHADVITEPLKTDLGLVLSWPQENWRCSDYELFQWDEFPGVYFLDFKNYGIQNLYLTRMAYFVEKSGYKGTFISDDEVVTLHGYNAHDYKARDLARFYDKAFKTGFSLNKKEMKLFHILADNGIIVQNSDGSVSEGKGCIISISRESEDWLRNQLMNHESWHGIYFEDEDFRKMVLKEYDSFDSGSLEFLLKYFSTQPSLNYDLNDDYLIKNEFMAYIMQNAVSNVKNYFVTRANWVSVNKWEGEEAAWVRKTDAQAFYDTDLNLTQYVFERWGIAAGRVALVSRIE